MKLGIPVGLIDEFSSHEKIACYILWNTSNHPTAELWAPVSKNVYKAWVLFKIFFILEQEYVHKLKCQIMAQ